MSRIPERKPVISSHLFEDPSLHTNLTSARFLEEIFYDICWDCRDMSSIPYGAHAARKVHYNMNKDSSWEFNVKMSSAKEEANESKWKNPSQFMKTAKQNLEHPPAKYNSKMMDSIWGLYNRYSVHNLKRVTDAKDMTFSGVQQLSAVASPSYTGAAENLLAAPAFASRWEAVWKY